MEIPTKRSRIGISTDMRADVIDINEIPEELLLRIFSYLSFSDRKNVRLVCKYWHKLSYDFSLIKSDVTVLHKNINLMQNPSPCSQHINVRVDLGLINIRTLYVIGSNEIFWLEHGQGVRYIEVKNISDTVFWFMSEIVFNCPLIEHASLHFTTNMRLYSERSLPKLFSDFIQFQNLRCLTLDGYSDYIVAMLNVAFRKAPKLISLYIDCFIPPYLVEEAQPLLNVDFRPIFNLKEISLSGPGMNNRFITGIADIFGTEVERLTIHLMPENRVSMTFLEGIAGRCVNLNHLALENISCKNHPHQTPLLGYDFLTSISLGESMELTDDMVASLAVLNNLQHFDMFCSCKLTKRGIAEVFGKRKRPQMRELRLRSMFHFSQNYDIMVEITPNLPNLKVLYLSGCEITRSSLDSLITHNLNLQCLILVGIYIRRPPYVRLRTTRMSKLLHLDVSNINIPKAIVENLELPSLRYLFCKYKNFQLEWPCRSLQAVRNDCLFLYYHYDALYIRKYKKCLTCCKSPFVNIDLK